MYKRSTARSRRFSEFFVACPSKFRNLSNAIRNTPSDKEPSPVFLLRIERTWDGSPAAPDETATVEIEPREGTLVIRVDAPYHGDAPPAFPPGPTEALWEHEAIEVFLLGSDENYLEIEMGPHGHHLALVLRGRRHAIARGLPLDYVARIEGERWRGVAVVPREWLPAGLGRVNAFAVHGQREARRHLAAFPVPGDRPDFHRFESFGELPRGALEPEPAA